MNYLQVPECVYQWVGRLSGLQLAIWCDAYTLTQQGMDAYRTNDQLADIFGVDERSVRRAVSKLQELGLIAIGSKGKARQIIVNPDRSVPGQVGPATRTGRSEKEDQSVRKGGQVGPPSRTISRTVSKSISRTEVELVFPFESDRFIQAWSEWREYKRTQFKFKFKTTKSEQLALHKLHKDTHGDEQQAIEAITTAIASGWRGLFPRTGGTGQSDERTAPWARDVAERIDARRRNQ